MRNGSAVAGLKIAPGGALGPARGAPDADFTRDRCQDPAEQPEHPEILQLHFASHFRASDAISRSGAPFLPFWAAQAGCFAAFPNPDPLPALRPKADGLQIKAQGSGYGPRGVYVFWGLLRALCLGAAVMHLWLPLEAWQGDVRLHPTGQASARYAGPRTGAVEHVHVDQPLRHAWEVFG